MPQAAAPRRREREVAERVPLLRRRLPGRVPGAGGADEEVVGRDGPANQGRLCVKGRFGFDYLRHPDRLTRPLLRIAPKDPADCLDPRQARAKFREASWEEAMERAASGLARIRDGVGPQALAGFGSAKGSNEEAYLFQKLVRTGFGTEQRRSLHRGCATPPAWRRCWKASAAAR